MSVYDEGYGNGKVEWQGIQPRPYSPAIDRATEQAISKFRSEMLSEVALEAAVRGYVRYVLDEHNVPDDSRDVLADWINKQEEVEADAVREAIAAALNELFGEVRE